MSDKLLGDFEEIFLQYMDSVYRTAVRFVSDYDEAEDLVQEAYLKAFRGFSRSYKIDNPRAWLFKILRNCIVDYYKARTKFKDSVSIETVEHTLVESEGPERQLELKAAGGRLMKALDEMPEEYRLSLLLCDSEGFSYNEISEIMDCPVGTVRSRINRARGIVRTAVHEEPGKGPGEND